MRAVFRRAARSPLVPVLLAGVAACVGSGPTEAAVPATFELVTVSNGAAPIPANVRSVQVVAGRLRFERFDRRPAAFSGSVTVRVTDPGAAPVTQDNTAAGGATWRGDTVTVLYDSGVRESFALEDGGATLRTVASSCGPNPCDAMLRINAYRRVAGVP